MARVLDTGRQVKRGDAVKRLWILLAALALFLLFFRLGENSLHDGDEAHYAQVAKEAVRGGHWITLHFGGEPWFEKPPAAIWIQAILFRAAGISETTIRLPAALYGLAAIIATAVLGSLLGGTRVGLLGATLLLLSPPFLYEHGVRSGEFDSATTLLTVVVFLITLRLARRGGSLVPLFAVTGIFFLVKSVVALLPLLIGGAVIYLARDAREKRLRGILPATVVLILIAAPWHIYQVLLHGSKFLDVYVGEHLVGRLRETFVKGRGATFYVETLSRAVYPWLPFFVLAWVHRVRLALTHRRSADILLSLWPAAIVGLFTLSSSRFAWYIYPALPAIFILIAGFLEESLSGPRYGRSFRWTLLLSGILLFVSRTNSSLYNPFLEKSINPHSIRQVIIEPLGPIDGIDLLAVSTGILLFLAGLIPRPRQDGPRGGISHHLRWMPQAAVATCLLLSGFHAVLPLRRADEIGPTKRFFEESRERGVIDFGNRDLYRASWYVAYFYADQGFDFQEYPDVEEELKRRRPLFKQIHGGRREERHEAATAPNR